MINTAMRNLLSVQNNLWDQGGDYGLEKSLGKAVFGANFCTSIVSFPRRTGKTTWIKEHATPNDLIVAISRQGYADFRDTMLVTSYQQLREIYNGQAVDIVYIDEPWLFSKSELSNVVRFSFENLQAKNVIGLGTFVFI